MTCEDLVTKKKKKRLCANAAEGKGTIKLLTNIKLTRYTSQCANTRTAERSYLLERHKKLERRERIILIKRSFEMEN